MRCVAVCQTELLIRMLDEALMPSFEVEFLVESKPLARKLHDAHLNVFTGDPRRTDTYLKADITPATCVIVEETAKRSLRRILEAIRDAGAALVYVIGIGRGDAHKHEEELRTIFPEVNYLPIAELFGQPLLMQNLLDIQVEIITGDQLAGFDRIAMVDVQPHYFGPEFHRVDLAIDHHPEQPGYSAVFKDIRPNYGSTSTILTEHLRAVDEHISERTATAMLYAIKSDTLFFNRQANRVDLEAFSYLYPLADAAMIRKMEGAEITMERLDYVLKAKQTSRLVEQVFCSSIGTSPREDFIPYVADFYLQLEDVKWTIVAGIVNDSLIMSVRNLGYSRNAGEFVRKYFADIGSAGGHRAMAKAVVPLRAFRDKFGNLQADEVTEKVLGLVLEFLHEHQAPEKKLVKA